MCDYSLQGLPNRLAMLGEQLVTHRFSTGSIGMASPFEIAASRRPKVRDCGSRGWWATLKLWFNPQMELDHLPAVCIPPGARLRMNGVPAPMQRSHFLRPVEDVTFVQLSAETYQYRDAIRFDNGSRVVLQSLAEGIPFEVLALDVEELEPQPEASVLLYPERAA
jgi:hypothetical protein